MTTQLYKHKFFSTMLALFACLSIFTTTPTLAAEQPNLMVFGEDADDDTIPRNSRIFSRVQNAMMDQLNQQGFDIYAEEVVTLDDYTQDRVRRQDEEIIDIARSVKNVPIDVAVLYSVYASANELDYTTKIKIRAQGRMLNVKSGQFLGSFEVSLPQDANAPTNCNRECLLEKVGDKSADLGAELANVLGIKLRAITDGSGNDNDGLAQGYNLQFKGFSDDVIFDIEENFVGFQGYMSHRPVDSTSLTHNYFYKSSSDQARLNRNIRKMMKALNIDARVVFSGNDITVTFIGTRKSAVSK